jgi:hypothetical protein
LEEAIEEFRTKKGLGDIVPDEKLNKVISSSIKDYETLAKYVHLHRKYENEIRLERSKTLLKALEAANKEMDKTLKKSLYTKGPSL